MSFATPLNHPSENHNQMSHLVMISDGIFQEVAFVSVKIEHRRWFYHRVKILAPFCKNTNAWQ
jgi:hypothetical protein